MIENVNADPIGSAQDCTGLFVQTSIPEPAVLALVDLGGFLVVVRRRCAKSKSIWNPVWNPDQEPRVRPRSHRLKSKL